MGYAVLRSRQCQDLQQSVETARLRTQGHQPSIQKSGPQCKCAYKPLDPQSAATTTAQHEFSTTTMGATEHDPATSPTCSTHEASPDMCTAL